MRWRRSAIIPWLPIRFRKIINVHSYIVNAFIDSTFVPQPFYLRKFFFEQIKRKSRARAVYIYIYMCVDVSVCIYINAFCVYNYKYMCNIYSFRNLSIDIKKIIFNRQEYEVRIRIVTWSFVYILFRLSGLGKMKKKKIKRRK